MRGDQFLELHGRYPFTAARDDILHAIADGEHDTVVAVFQALKEVV